MILTRSKDQFGGLKYGFVERVYIVIADLNGSV